MSASSYAGFRPGVFRMNSIIVFQMNTMDQKGNREFFLERMSTKNLRRFFLSLLSSPPFSNRCSIWLLTVSNAHLWPFIILVTYERNYYRSWCFGYTRRILTRLHMIMLYEEYLIVWKYSKSLWTLIINNQVEHLYMRLEGAYSFFFF